MNLTIACWNVNSIKSRLHHLLPWLKETAPSIVLLQELKTTNDGFPFMEIEELGYNLAVHGQKTYNGVAILSKLPLEDIRMGLPGDETDEQARYVEAVAGTPQGAIRIASVYVPNGQSPDSDKFTYKLKFLNRLYTHAQSLLEFNEPLIIGGDYNVGPYPIDVYDSVKLDGTVCYHPLEREAMRRLLHIGLYDAYRVLHPLKQEFSWWDYRDVGFDSGHGLRIDHLLLSAQAMDRLSICEIIRELRMLERPSDHAPVMCTLEMG